MNEAEQLELERDFCIACNMMLGQSYDQAKESAIEWVNESRDKPIMSLTPEQRQLRSNIRGFLMVATIEQLEKELEISIERKDTFRATVIREMIEEEQRA